MLSDEIYNTSSREIIKQNFEKMKQIKDNNEREIENTKNNLELLSKNDKVREYLSLLNDDSVKEYIDDCNKLDSLNKERFIIEEKYSFLHQRICDHPAYFVVAKDISKTTKEEFYTCLCVECGKGITRKVNNFEGMILIHPRDYENIDEQFREYQEEFKKIRVR